MKKFFTTLASGLMLIAGTVSANALTTETWEMGETYNGFKWDNGPALCLVYTPASSGTLTVVQTGESMSHVYTEEWDGNSYFNAYNDSHLIPYTDNTVGSTTTMKFEVVKGVNYYFYAKVESADAISSMSATFESNGKEDEFTQIELGVPFESNSQLCVFNPEKDGLLTITATCNYQSAWLSAGASAQGLLFSDPTLQRKVHLTCLNPNTSDRNLQMTCVVQGGKTYYLYNTLILPLLTFTFELADMPEISLVNVTPEAGKVMDAEADYGSGVLLQFFPNDVTFADASVTYTPVGETAPVTVTLNPNAGVGENSDMSYEADGQWKFRAVSRYYAKAAEATSVTLTLTGANWQGQPVTGNQAGDNGISVDNGTVIVSWMLPEEKMVIESQSWPDAIYATYPSGTSAGKATITFNMNVDSEPGASLVFGRQYWGSGSAGDEPDPSTDLPCKVVNGNTIEVDFNGVNYGQLYLEGSSAYSEVTVFINNIIGEDGQKFIQANPGIAQYLPYFNSASSSVSEINVSGAAEGPVYNLQGVKVADDAANLAPGLYIVGGKKVVVK